MKAVDIAKELIKFDTSGPPTQEQPCAEWIKEYLDELGFETVLHIVEPSRANVVAKYGVGKEPGLVLSGHIDVVLSGDPSLWKVSGPFDPVVKDGKLYGRGACDMKGPDACIIQAAEDLINEDFKKQLTLVFTAGEDTGGWFVDRVLSDKLVTPDDALCEFCAVMDGVKIRTADNFLPAGQRLEGAEGGGLSSKFDVGHPPLHPNCRCVVVPGVL